MKGAPIFIVGCGRSGTTALGDLLGSHPRITYLNEPRKLWKVDPRTDVWSKNGADVGSLDLYEVEPSLRPRVRKALFKRASTDTFLVEKTPVNSFRIDYLRSLFPNARFIHLLRNGLDVARSIQKWCESGRLWFGQDDLKWKLLVDYADRQGLGALVAKSAADPRLRGLLEWRLAVSDSCSRESAALHRAAGAAEELALKVDVSQGAWCGKVRLAAACVPRDVVGPSGRTTEDSRSVAPMGTPPMVMASP